MIKFQPYLVRDCAMFVQAPIIAAAPTFCGVIGVHRQVFMPGLQLAVVDRALLTELDKNGRFTAWTDSSLQDVISGIKPLMLEHGATPEAIRLVGEISPFSKKELSTMAEKLAKGKGAAKAEPKTKPVAGGGKAAKGNADALAAARDAKKQAAATDKRKVTLTEKGKERAKSGKETGAVANLLILQKAKTVADAIAAGLAMSDLNYAEKSGTLEIG